MRFVDASGWARSILRMVAGLLFTMHGLQKIAGMFGGLGGHGASARIGTQFWVAGVVETFGGILIILGLFTRPLAFLLCGEMAVAYFRSHFPRGLWPLVNGGELAVLYCFIYLYLFAAGAGPISLDRILRRKK